MGCSGNNAKYTTLEGCQPHIRKILKENTTYFLRNEYFFDESEQWVRRVFYIVLHFFIIHWMGKHMDLSRLLAILISFILKIYEKGNRPNVA